MGTLDIGTLPVNGKRGYCHAEEVMDVCGQNQSSIVRFQETRRGVQDGFTAADFIVYCSGASGNGTEAKGQYGVGMCIKEWILQDLKMVRLVVEDTSARLRNVRLNLKGKSSGSFAVFAYAPTDGHKSVSEKYLFWATLGSKVAEMGNGEHLLVMLDANARTGARGKGCVDDQMLRAYGRDTPNGNERPLVAVSAENQYGLVNAFFSAPKAGIPFTFQSRNRGFRCYRLDFILPRQHGRRLVRSVTVHRHFIYTEA